MDTSDPDIVFDVAGVCNHCQLYDTLVRDHLFERSEAERRLADIVATIKEAGQGKPYDCVIGVSGGVDSTYVAYHVKKLGLRPLAVHLDNGWDSELAVKNIETTLKKVGIDLETHVLDWEEFRDLQLSFLKASSPDSEIPTDHAIMAVLHQTARRLRLRHVVTGFNVRTESHMPRAWSQGHADWKYIRSVQRQFGRARLCTFPHTSFAAAYYYRATQRWVHILNYLDYSKPDALRVLQEELGWRYYGGKHYESIYTRFYQGYILPRKFGFDKRRAHFSSMICSGQLERSAAIETLASEPPYDPSLQEADYQYVIKKLRLTRDEFEAILQRPPKRYSDYPSYGRMYQTRAYAAARVVYRAVLKPIAARLGRA